MATLSLGFDLLPALCEGDEHISLADILGARDASLTDEELWAVCHECCMALQSVYNSSEMFQYLCVMPETLAFDAVGAVCFLDLPSEPSTIYIPPEYATVGNSFKAHLYSLGMTMMFAAEYNPPQEEKRELSSLLNTTLSKMTADDYDDRITLDQVLMRCTKALKGNDPAHVCYQLSNAARRELSMDEAVRMEKINSSVDDVSSDSTKEDLLPAPYTFTTRALLGQEEEEGPRAMSSPNELHNIPSAASSPRLHTQSGEPDLGDLISDDIVAEESRPHVNMEELRGDDEKIREAGAHVGDPSCDNKERLQSTNDRTGAEINQIGGDLLKEGEEAKQETESVNDTESDKAVKEGDEAGMTEPRTHYPDDDTVDVSDKAPTVNKTFFLLPRGISSGGEVDEGDVGDVGDMEEVEDTPSPTHPAMDKPGVSQSAGQAENNSSASESTQAFTGSPPVAAAVTVAATEPACAAGYDSGYSSQNTVLTPEPADVNKQAKHDAEILEIATGLDEDTTVTTTTEEDSNTNQEASVDGDMEEDMDFTNAKAQSVSEILGKLGCGLHEEELWSLCRECVLGLQKNNNDLPAYISLETVYIEESGEVAYLHASEDEDLDVVYLAPELQQYGVVTDKTCLFGIAAMLWSAADYKMPSNQEPALSEKFENLLVSMTQENSERRPAMSYVLQACDTFHKHQGVESSLICQTLSADAQKAHHFNGKNNSLVRDLIDEDLEQKVHDYKAQILDDIREAQVQLKPASERQLAKRTVELTLRDKLMAEILDPSRKLRKASKTRKMNIKDLYDCNPEFYTDLLRATGKLRGMNQTLNASFSDQETVKEEPEKPSAFNTVHSLSDNSPSASGGEAAIPEAYRSSATHFTPIVLSAADAAAASKEEKREKPKTRQLPKPDKDIDVAKKIKELKKNLMKNRPPLNLAQDLENDLAREEASQKARQGRPRSDDRPREGRPWSGGTRPKSEDARPKSGESTRSGGRLKNRTPPPLAPSEQHVLKLAKEDFDRYLEFGTDVETAAEEDAHPNPVNTQHSPHYAVPQTQTQPQVQMHPDYNTQLNPHPHQQQQYAFPHGHQIAMQGQQMTMPNQVHPLSLPLQGHQMMAPGQSMPVAGQGVRLTSPPAQFPGYPYPMTMPGAMFPFQVQLQQDPATGLFQIIPVPVPAVPNQNGAMSPQDAPFATTPPVIGRPSSGSSTHTHSTNQPSPRSPPPQEEMTEKVIPKKPPRQTKKDVPPHRPQQRSRSDGSGEERRREASYEAQSRSQSQKALRRTASHVDELFSNHVIDNHSQQQRSARTNSVKTNSVERLDKIDEIPKVKPKKLRELKQKSKLRRAKSGSSLDFKNSINEMRALHIYDDSMYFNHGAASGDSLQYSNGLSKSQPSLYENGAGDPRHRRRRRKNHASPDDGSPSPPLSPSWSKDSGVSGVNLKGTGDLTLMERLLSSDTIKHQQKLSRVIRLLREEFAFDGYMENGIEDLAMAEYILSLANLRWDTFVSAVTEKYCDLYWQDDLLISLYEAVNGVRPKLEKRLREAIGKVPEAKSPRKSPKNKPSPKKSPARVEPDHDCYDGSAFRPINGAGPKTQNLDSSGSLVKPRAVKLTSSEDTDSSDPTAKPKKSKPPRKRILDKQKSSSLHNLTESSSHDELEGNGISKAKSDKNLTQNQELSYNSPGITLQSLSKAKYSASFSEPKPRMIYVKSNSVVESQSTQGSSPRVDQNLENPFAMPDSIPVTSQSCIALNRYDSDSSSHQGAALWENLRANPDIPRGLKVVKATSFRKDSLSSESSAPSLQYNNVHRKYSMAKTSMSHPNESTDAPTDTEGGDAPEMVDVGADHFTVDEWIHRGAVIYYYAEMEGNLRADVKDITSQVDPQTKENIEAKMTEIKQNIVMEERNKRKTLKYYSRLIETTKSNKVSNEQKTKLATVSKQITETNDKLRFLDAAHKHLEMLHAEQWGVDHDLLYALAKCPGDQPMLLSACDNELIQYQPVRNPRTGMNVQGLQAGTPLGLCTYLFAQHSLSEGFIHQFFYCYRYFLTPHELLDYLCDKFNAATLSLSPEAQVPAKVKARTLDLFQVWMEGYFSVDFQFNPDLQNTLRNFIRDKVIPEDSGYKHLLELLECCRDGNIAELQYKDFVQLDNSSPDDDVESDTVRKEDWMGLCVDSGFTTEPGGTHSPNISRTKGWMSKLLCGTEAERKEEWETMKAALHLSAKPQSLVGNKTVGCVSNNNPGDAYHPKTGPRRTDSFALADYTPQSLAEQLTLMEQDLFVEIHPVHYLNSRAQGISVALAKPVMSKTQSLTSINSAWEDNHSSSLFQGSHVMDDMIQRIVEHSQSISFWVAAEVLSCDSSKSQVAVLSKFIYTAKACEELRNFATCMAIVDGLENIIIKQLPVWKSIPTKCGALLDDMANIKMQLKSDSMWLMTNQTTPLSPLIPCTFLFLLHVQQQEIGGFKLANGMYKWHKMRSLCKLIDQIRAFKQRRYRFPADVELHESIRQRIREFGQQDLHQLASQNQTNFQKVTKKPSIFRRMTGKFQRKSDV